MRILITIILLFVSSMSTIAQTWTLGTNVGAAGGTLFKPKKDIDLIGADGRSIQKHKYMYDGTGYDPANGVLNITTGGILAFLPENQFPEFYPAGNVKNMVYTDSIGNLTLLDFSGAKDEFDTSAQTTFKSIYAAETSSEVGDTLYFYAVDKFLSLAPQLRAMYLYHAYRDLIPFAKIATKNRTREWTSVLTTGYATARYVLVRGMLKSRGDYKSTPLFTEVAFYATQNAANSSVIRRPSVYTGSFPAKTPFSKFVGTNIGQGQRPDVLASFCAIRVYGYKNYWSTSASATDTSNEVYTYDNFADIGPAQYPIFKAAGQKFWWSIRGVSAGYQAAYGNGDVDIDHKTDDPIDPLKWTREAQFAFYYAAKHGAVAVPTTKTPHWNNNTGNGLNDVSIVEPGNEEDYVVLPIVTVNKMNAWWDGYEGRLGTNVGVKTADPNFFLMAPGIVEQDTSLVNTLIFLAKTSRTDKKVPWDGFNYHHYSRNTNDIVGNVNCADRAGATSRSPEKDHITSNIIKFAGYIYNLLDGDTSKQIWNTETGYSNWATLTNDGTYACNVNYDDGNLVGVLIPGVDSLQCKAIVMERMELKLNASPLTGYNDFFFHNSSYGANTYSLFSSYGMTTGRDAVNFIPTIYFPWWYTHNSAVKLLTGWVIDSIYNNVLIDDTGLNVIRYKNIASPDSLKWAVWKGTTSGTTITGATINVGSMVGGNMYQEQAQFNSITPSKTTISATGTLTVSATERVVYYSGKLNINTGGTKVYRAKVRISI